MLESFWIKISGKRLDYCYKNTEGVRLFVIVGFVRLSSAVLDEAAVDQVTGAKLVGLD
jgi:hypothetical protein